jgi:hypothetical protein
MKQVGVRTRRVGSRGPLLILAVVVGIVAAALLFRRRKSRHRPYVANQQFRESNFTADWAPPDQVAESPDASEAPTAVFPLTAGSLATEVVRPVSDRTAWTGREGGLVFDIEGEKVGRLQSTYFDDQTGTPEWGLVSFGAVRLSLRFVPLQNARLADDGVHLEFSNAQIHAAPEVDADGHVTQEEEDSLYAHYALAPTGRVSFTRPP